jgi:hypothetical protein
VRRQLEPRQRFRCRRRLSGVADVTRLDFETVGTCGERNRIGSIDRFSVGMGIDDDAMIVVFAAGIVEIVGAAAGLRGQRTIEQAAAGVAGVISAAITIATAAITIATAATIIFATTTAATGWGRRRGGGGGRGLLRSGVDIARAVDLEFLLAAVVTMAAMAIPIRPVRVVSVELAVLLGIVPVIVLSISVVAAAPIPIGLISATTIVLTTLVFARGKAARHARGQQRRC